MSAGIHACVLRRASFATTGIVALVACAGQGAAPGRSTAAHESSAAPPPASSASSSVAPAAPPPLPDGLVVTTERVRERIGLVIQNRSPSPVQLALIAGIERVAAAAGSPAGAIGELVRLDCAAGAPQCITLVPGAELRPPPWPGALAQAQCEGGSREAASAGRYVLRVRGCAAGPRDSAPFDVP